MTDCVKQRAREWLVEHYGWADLHDSQVDALVDFAFSEYRAGWEAGIEAAAKQFEHSPGQHDNGNTEKYCDTCEIIAAIRSLKFEEFK